MNRRNLLITGLAAAMAASISHRAVFAADLTPVQEHPLARQNYLPDAPVRATVGRGKVITGTVRSTRSGAPLAGTRIEFWLNTTPNGGDDGERNPANRGQVVADAQGRFRFETDPPARVWSNAAPHIHTRVTAEGHEPFYLRHITDAAVESESVSIVLVSA